MCVCARFSLLSLTVTKLISKHRICCLHSPKLTDVPYVKLQCYSCAVLKPSVYFSYFLQVTLLIQKLKRDKLSQRLHRCAIWSDIPSLHKSKKIPAWSEDWAKPREIRNLHLCMSQDLFGAEQDSSNRRDCALSPVALEGLWVSKHHQLQTSLKYFWLWCYIQLQVLMFDWTARQARHSSNNKIL